MGYNLQAIIHAFFSRAFDIYGAKNKNRMVDLMDPKMHPPPSYGKL